MGFRKAGSPFSLCVALKRAWVMNSKLSACSIRSFLFADVLADLLQLQPDCGHGITAGPEMLTCEFSLLPAQSGYGDGALPHGKPDHRDHGDGRKLKLPVKDN